MAEIVAAFGVPHTPNFPALVAKQGPDCRTAQLYAEIAAATCATRPPDVLVIYTDDHFNTFFLDNFPTFAIGIADQTSGPNDQTAMPSYRVAGRGIPGESCARQGDRRRLRSLARAGFRSRPFHHGPAAFSHARHGDSDRPGLHQRPGAALAELAALHALGHAVTDAIEDWPGRSARRGDRQRQLLARDRRAENSARRTCLHARSGMGQARAGSSRTWADCRADRGSHRLAVGACRQYRRRIAQLDRHAGRGR